MCQLSILQEKIRFSHRLRDGGCKKSKAITFKVCKNRLDGKIQFSETYIMCLTKGSFNKLIKKYNIC